MLTPDLFRISETVSRLFQRAETMLPPEIGMKIECAMDKPFETNEGKAALTNLLLYFIRCGLNNKRLFTNTDEAVIYAIYGEELNLTDMALSNAITAGIFDAYRELPFSPTPVVHLTTVSGSGLHLIVQPRTSIVVFTQETATGHINSESLISWIINQLCERKNTLSFPVFLGVGLSTSAEVAEQLADSALIHYMDVPNPDPDYGKLEQKLLANTHHLCFVSNNFQGKQAVLGTCINADVSLDRVRCCTVKVAPALLRRTEVKL